MFVNAICLCLYAAWSVDAAFVNQDRYEFKYTINNKLREPYFLSTKVFTIEQFNKPFVEYMKDAVLSSDMDFTSFQLNFSSPYGFLVNSVNGAFADYTFDKSCWLFANQSGRLNKGVGTYIPNPGEDIILKLTIDEC